jgi:prevent-host-death family protein
MVRDPGKGGDGGRGGALTGFGSHGIMIMVMTMVIFGRGEAMLTVSKSQLKAKMLEYFRMVEERGEEITVTSHGRPVLRITRLEHVHAVGELFADVRGRAVIDDSVLEPETDEWPEV